MRDPLLSGGAPPPHAIALGPTVCDCCAQPEPQPAWLWPTRQVNMLAALIDADGNPVAAREVNSDPGWCFCQACHQLALAHDVEGFLQRGWESLLRLHPDDVGRASQDELVELRQGMRQFQEHGFWSAVCGPPVPLVSL